MIAAAKVAGHQLLVGMVRQVCRFPAAVAVVCLVLTGLSLWYVVNTITISSSTDELLSRDLPYRQGIFALREAFPKSGDRLLVVVESVDTDQVINASRILAQRMRERPDLFSDLIAAEDEPFFRRNGLLYLDITALEERVDQLAAAQPFLGSLRRDPSLRGLFALLSRIAEHGEEAETLGEAEVVRLFDAVSGVIEAEARGEAKSMAWRQLIAGDDALAEAHQRFLSVAPAFDFSNLRPARVPIETLRQWAGELAAGPFPGLSVRLTDEAALGDDELQTVTVGMSAASTVSIVTVIALMWLGFRSPRTTVAAVAVMLVGLIWTAAFGVAVIGSFNLISVAFAVLFIGLSVDFSIHYALRFREIAERTGIVDASLVEASSRVGGALTLAAAAASLGFLAFLPTAYTGIAELGVIAAGGMVIAHILTFTLLPALMMLVHPRLKRQVRWDQAWQTTLEQRFRRFGRPLTVLALVLAAGGAVLARDAYFDFDPLRIKAQDSESVSTLLALIDADPSRAYAISVLADSLEESQRIAAVAAGLASVSGTRTIGDFVPADQDAKVDLVGDLRLILGPSLAATPIAPPTVDDLRTATERLRAATSQLATTAAGEALAPAAARLATAVTGLLSRAAADPAVFDDLTTRLVDRLPDLFADVTDLLAARPFDIADLPAALREQWLNATGQALVQILPAGPVHRDRDLLSAFVTEVRAAIPEATGAPVAILEGGRVVLNAFIEAGVIALLAIATMLLVILRSLRDTLIVFAPIFLAALLTVAASVLMAIPFNFANVIVLPLLFGLGVAGSLHLVMRERANSATLSAMMSATSTPRAVVFSAMTTIASFGSLMISAHPGMKSMGILLTVSIALVLLCTLVFLPAILEILGRDHRRGEDP